MWKKFPDKEPLPDWDIDWSSRSVKCLIKDDWNEIHLARLQWDEDQFEYVQPARWYLDGQDDYLFVPRGTLYWIALEDLLGDLNDSPTP